MAFKSDMAVKMGNRIGGPEGGHSLSWAEASRIASGLNRQGKGYKDIIKILVATGATQKAAEDAAAPYSY